MSSVQTLNRMKQHLVQLKFALALKILYQTVEQLENIQIAPLEALEAILSHERGIRKTRRFNTQLRTSRLIRHKSTGNVRLLVPTLV